MKFVLRLDTEVEGHQYPYSWDVVASGEVIAKSPAIYGTEAEARSAIAKARKAFAGARFAKVVPADG